jgi:hypothetical protein
VLGDKPGRKIIDAAPSARNQLIDSFTAHASVAAHGSSLSASNCRHDVCCLAKQLLVEKRRGRR